MLIFLVNLILLIGTSIGKTVRKLKFRKALRTSHDHFHCN